METTSDPVTSRGDGGVGDAADTTAGGTEGATAGDAAEEAPAEPAAEPPPTGTPDDQPGDAPADAPAGVPAEAATEPPATSEPAGSDAWSRPADWQVEATAWVPHQPGGDQVAAGPVTPPGQVDHSPYPEILQDELEDPEDDEWVDEYHDGALFAAIFSAPSLALAAFVFALTGLLGGMIPESLPYLVQVDPASGPAHLIRIVGLIDMGFAIVAASLGLAAMLRAVGSPLRWPTYLGGAAVLLALLIALQSVLLILLAGAAPQPGGSN